MISRSSRDLVIGTIWSFVGRLGYLAVGLAGNVMLARLLSPEDFGKIAVVMFFISVFTVLVESGLSGALIRKQDATEIDYSTVFVFNMFVSIVLMILLIGGAGVVSSVYDDESIKALLVVASSILVLNALRITQTVRLVKSMSFRKKVACEFFSILIASVVAIFFAWRGMGVWSLVAMQWTSSAALALILWCVVGPVRSLSFCWKSFRGIYSFGVNTTLASLLSSVFDNIYQVIIGKFFSIQGAGYFYQSKKLQDMPIGILQAAILGPVYSALSKLQGKPSEFAKTHEGVNRVFTVAVGAICTLIFIYADALIYLLYGDKWLAAAHYLQFLSAASFFYFQEIFNRVLFKVYDRTEYILKLELLKKLFQVATIGFGLWFMSIDFLLFGFVLSNMFGFLSGCFCAKKIGLGQGRGGGGVVVKVLTASTLTAGACYFLGLSFDVYGLTSLVCVPLIVMVYLGALVLLKVVRPSHDVHYIRAFVARKKI